MLSSLYHYSQRLLNIYIYTYLTCILFPTFLNASCTGNVIFEGCCLAAENLCAVVVCVFCEDGAVKMYTISGCAGHLQLMWGCSTVMNLSHKITEK